MNDEASASHADPSRAFDGQYQLGNEIGAGAHGVVYRGVNERLDKPVAIKVWHARLEEDAPLREQFDIEARVLTALEHPNIVTITDYGIAGQAPYMVMELLEGQTLDERMRQGALSAMTSQRFMEGVLRALGYMHMRGVVHRNLRPDNVFLQKLDESSEQLKLLDMCLESLPANTNAEPARAPRSAYVAPEHDAGAEPDGRSDVFAAGVLMLHMLMGREPTRELVRAVADSADLLEKLVPSASPEVWEFIGRAVATERGSRFGNADQMLRAMLELASPWAGNPPGYIAPVKHKSEPPPMTAVGDAATVVLDAAEGGEQTPEDAQQEEAPFGPIGLMARLRAYKRALWIAGGGFGVVAVAGGVALWLQRSATERAPQGLSTQHATAEKQRADESAEPEDEEDEDEEVVPIIQRAQPEPEHAAQEPSKYARLADETAAPVAHTEGEPNAKDSAPDASHGAEPAQASAPVEAPTQLPAETASGHAHESADTAEGAREPSGHGDPPAAASGDGRSVASAGAPVAAKASEHKTGTPVPMGAERHIEPDKDEIRQMLALAIAPKPRVPASDPWDIEVPSSLQALRDAIAQGERGSAGNLSVLRRYNAANRDDVYGHLLLAGFYANRGYSLDALDQYDMAYRIDPSSRGASEMLKHALSMVAEGVAERDAVRFIENVYGREALTEIAQRARAPDTEVAASRRLLQLQARIAGKRR